MKKVFLSFSLLIFSVLCVFSQSGEMSVGIRGGLSIPKIKAVGDNPMSQGYSSRLTGGGGVFFEYRFSELFSIRPGVEFLQEGGKRDGMQAIPARMLAANPKFAQLPDAVKQQMPPYLYADFDSKTSFDYLMVPLLAQVGWNLGEKSPFRVYVNAGPFISFLLSANQTTSGSSQIYMNKEGTATIDQMLTQYHIPITVGEVPFNVDESIKSQTNDVNWGVSGNVGFAYQMNKHRFFIEVGGNYGFQRMQKTTENGDNRIGAGTVMLGYAYQFK